MLISTLKQLTSFCNRQKERNLSSFKTTYRMRLFNRLKQKKEQQSGKAATFLPIIRSVPKVTFLRLVIEFAVGD